MLRVCFMGNIVHIGEEGRAPDKTIVENSHGGAISDAAEYPFCPLSSAWQKKT